MLKVVEARYLLLAVGAFFSLFLFYATSRQYGDDIVYGVKSQTGRILHPQQKLGPYGPSQAKAHLKKGQSSNVLDIFNATPWGKFHCLIHTIQILTT